MIMVMTLMMTMVILMCFLHPKGPLTGLTPGDKIYDVDDDDDDNDD